MVHDSRTSLGFTHSQSLGIAIPDGALTGDEPHFIATQQTERAPGIDRTVFSLPSSALFDCRLADANNDWVGKLSFALSR